MKCEFDQQEVKSAAKILVWACSVSQSHGPLGSIRDTMGSSGQGELLVSYGLWREEATGFWNFCFL